MNSILQCLSNTKELRDYCLQNQYVWDLNSNSRMRTVLMAGKGSQLPAARAGRYQCSTWPVPLADWGLSRCLQLGLLVQLPSGE